jgi:flagellar biosynthesis protein FlhG
MIDLEADYILIDLSAGNSYTVLDLFLAADTGLIVINPDPLSILNGFHFIKNALFRKLLQTFKIYPDIHRLIEEAENRDYHTDPSVIESLKNELKKTNREVCKRMESMITNFTPAIIINGYKNSDDEIRGLAVVAAAKKVLNLSVGYLGYLHYDKSVPAAVREGLTFLAYNSKNHISRDLIHIIKNGILNNGPEKRRSVRPLKQLSENLRSNGISPVICTYDCQYWEICEFKKGGFPCIVGKL